jgi:Tfp pilus assembly protein PilE
MRIEQTGPSGTHSLLSSVRINHTPPSKQREGGRCGVKIKKKKEEKFSIDKPYKPEGIFFIINFFGTL